MLRVMEHGSGDQGRGRSRKGFRNRQAGGRHIVSVLSGCPGRAPSFALTPNRPHLIV